ncbi:MAG: F0F1 ATP synthase subunit A [Gorillibacterium sp.]|nr:F0F1 ATP synthase subunit A [Gorillibacterium sp.]
MHAFPTWKISDNDMLNIDLASFLAIVVTCLVIFILARLAVRNLSVTNPSKVQNFMEWIVEFVQGVIANTQDFKKGKIYLSLATTLILFIFVSNLIGLPLDITTEHHEPLSAFGYDIVSQEDIDHGIAEGHEGAEVSWWKSPTADLSVTAGLAATIFAVIHFEGLRRNRKHYLKHYFKPFWFFFPINILETLAKPLTLALRLYANIYAGEVLIATILGAGIYGIPLMIVWQGFSLFVAAIQAFLFTILTMVYIAGSTIHDEEHA